MQSTEQKLRQALRIAISYIDMDVLYTFRGEDHDLIKEALELQIAAAVGEQEAFGYFYMVNGVHEGFIKGPPPPDDSYDEGTLVPVYSTSL